MTILDTLMKNSSSKMTNTLTDSVVYGKKDLASTSVPMINVALSGSFDGGVTSGLTMIAGPSKHFKTAFTLLLAAAYLKKHKDAAVLFYDSEFGTPQSYFDAFGIDQNRVIHTPITDVEQLKFDIMKQLDGLKRGDKVCIIVDSIGNLASKKEVDDALDGKSVADMSRAKSIKSLFRMVTPHLSIKDIPMIAVNHTYAAIMGHGQTVSGGCLVEGTKVWTIDGLKEIQNFQEGDIVQTLLGEKLVTNVWNPETLIEGEPECYEIEFDDGYTCIVSENHKFLTENDSWIEAKNITENMTLINTCINNKDTGIYEEYSLFDKSKTRKISK